ncbi:hypothetical protein [Candidatus Ichthyocystis sparus]|uniref:hypothetical protein n=1 Tax=Candidatus Ichthyocystis sparus TaxID=1561004 RepID=UPI000B85D172|nr:hypothetical protein [Candidatus Ichthyocystis sparus]
MTDRLLSVSVCIPESPPSEEDGLASANYYATNKLSVLSQQSTNKPNSTAITTCIYSHTSGTYRTKKRNCQTELSSDSEDDNTPRSKKRICKYEGSYQPKDYNTYSYNINPGRKKRTYEVKSSSDSEDNSNLSSGSSRKDKKRSRCGWNEILSDAFNSLSIEYDKNGFTVDGLHRSGFYFGGFYFDEGGFDKHGFNRMKVHINGSKYDDEGFDADRINKQGYNKHGFLAR